jgi:hypothetical protein
MEETSSKWSFACHPRLVASLPEGTDKLGYVHSCSPRNVSESSGTSRLKEIGRSHNMKVAQETHLKKLALQSQRSGIKQTIRTLRRAWMAQSV